MLILPAFLALPLIISTLQDEQPTHYNFRSIFRTPKDAPAPKRNYDDFEILERASFHSEGSEAAPTTSNNTPKASASAQIHVRIADKRSVKEPDTKPDVDDTLKKLLIMLIKPLVENNAPGRVNPFFPFPPSPHPSPPYSHLLGGLSALSSLSGSPEALKKAAKIAHKLQEKIKASSAENEVEELKKTEEIPLKITLNNKPVKLQAEDNASVAQKSEKLIEAALTRLLAKEEDEEEEEKPKRKRKKPKLKAVDPLEVYMRRISAPAGFFDGAPNLIGDQTLLGQQGALCGFCQRYNCHPLFGNVPLAVKPLDWSALLVPKVPQVNPLLAPNLVPTPRPDVLATEFVVHVPVLIKNKQPAYNSLVNYPLLSSLLSNYGKCVL